MAVLTLPPYPSARTRQSLSPSQLATLNNKISGTLTQALSLPPNKRDIPSIRVFVSSYAKDHAYTILETLIWDADHASHGQLSKMSRVEKDTYQRVLKLADLLAADLCLQAVIDLAVVYGRATPKRTRAFLASVASASPTFVQSLEMDAIPAFTSLLASTTQGLYGLRKIAHIISSFLIPAPPDAIRPFARNKQFVMSLATAYDRSLRSLSRSYGGLRPERLSNPNVPLDDWERVFLETKVELIDILHVLLRTLLKDIEEVSSAGPSLAARCDAAFEIIFTLLELQPGRAAAEEGVPFMNCTILEDYQHSYGLSKIIAQVTRRADDARTELLESALSALDSQDGQIEPGALRLLIRSSGMPPGIDNRGKGPSRVDTKGKGRAAPPPPPPVDPALDAAVAQVLDILPDQDLEYVRYVLGHPDFPFKGDGERLLGALLEGTAPQVDPSEYAGGGLGAAVPELAVVVPEDRIERRNVFDDEKLDVSKLRIGKKQNDAGAALQDRAFIEQMKADILRRAEAMSDEEDEENVTANGGKASGVDIAFEDELDAEGGVRVRDGQPSEDEGDQEIDGDDEEAKTPAKPETILELAYIRDPKLFDRDAQTRRSKARQDLKSQTGWGDEQIEGWRIMLDRNPNKDKILQKHEFAGNQRSQILSEVPGPSAHHEREGHRGGGGGRGNRGGRGGGGRGRGRGRGGAAGQSQGGTEGSSGKARDRAWKDKNKASAANHNRKRGHDKKMARVDGPS
ncbi:hypothetical protein PHLGIDRAFT_459334 [Phlebiopsis gigantea 11061_1 CR5-6]|uniref:CUE domain-containing protein n=1 Tax=Phlebiopsis gigantea (strain 11061_1 CR5-6) TaxID=745531 RepID=A0A0C3RXC2_PHLG1|nr:hypothetical protein PHLGIDRAFT_459334 [Phlebiopsis gigantea 11061_1 CR5-6]